MPDEPENSTNLPNRHRPHLSELSKETTEDDLWDLDDNESASKKSPTPAAQEPTTEPRKKPAKSADFEIKPEPRSKPGKPSTKEAAPKHPEAKQFAEKAEGSVSSGISPRSVDPKARPEPPKASLQIGTRPLDPKPEKRSYDRPADDDPFDDQPTDENPEEVIEQPKDEVLEREPTTPKEEPPLPKKKDESATSPSATEKSEKIGLIALGVVFLGITIWWLTSLFSSISTTRIGDDQPDFPIEGSFATVAEGETYWRAPVRDGPNPDVALSEVEFIPALHVELESSQSGVLRAIFRDDQGDFVGDSISRRFANGMFDENASPSIELPATDGFDKLGEFNGYRVGEDRWTVDLFEGPSADAPGSEFKLLFSAPISTIRR